MTEQVRGADLLVRALKTAGTERLFTLSGNQILSIFDATIDTGIDLIHVRHEAAAVHMADAWGRLTGEPGVALVTAGPGFGNVLTALYVAHMAESPMILLSGHAPQGQLGRGAFQEMDQAEMARPVTKASWTLTEPSELGPGLAWAFRSAKAAPPGPVHLSLPVDLLESTVPPHADWCPQPDQFSPVPSRIDDSTARQILDALRRAERPLVLCGPSLLRGRAGALRESLADATGVPVVGMESPRGVHDPSLGAFEQVLAEADLILLLGKPLDFMLRFGDAPTVRPSCRFIQIGAGSSALEQTLRALGDPSRLLHAADADPVAAARRLVELARRPRRRAGQWYDEVQTAIRYRPAQWASLASPSGGPLHAVEVCRAVQAFLDEDAQAVFISDGGEFGQWAQACIHAPRRLINGPSGAIGSAIPFALAARLAFPRSRIVTMLGDGTFGLHAMEFDTAVRHKLPFVAVVGNDARWNAEYQIQLQQFGPDRTVGCALLPTRYDRVAAALGGYGRRVSAAAELPTALGQAHKSNLPACVNVPIEPHAAPQIRRS